MAADGRDAQLRRASVRRPGSEAGVAHRHSRCASPARVPHRHRDPWAQPIVTTGIEDACASRRNTRLSHASVPPRTRCARRDSVLRSAPPTPPVTTFDEPVHQSPSTLQEAFNRAARMLAGRGPAPGDRVRVRRRTGAGRRRDHRVARRPRHHPDRAPRATGPGPGREARGRRGAELHEPGRRPAPPPPPADQRTSLRRRRVAKAALGRRRGLHRGDQRDRTRRRQVRPRLPRRARRARVHA